MNESQIQEYTKFSITIEMEVLGNETKRYLPDSIIVRFDRKKDSTEEEEVIQKHSRQLISVNNKISNSEIGLDKKLKLFIDIFRALTGDDRNDVKKEILIDELINTCKYAEEEATAYLKKAQQYGFIFERKMGMFALA